MCGVIPAPWLRLLRDTRNENSQGNQRDAGERHPSFHLIEARTVDVDPLLSTPSAFSGCLPGRGQGILKKRVACATAALSHKPEEPWPSSSSSPMRVGPNTA